MVRHKIKLYQKYKRHKGLEQKTNGNIRKLKENYYEYKVELKTKLQPYDHKDNNRDDLNNKITQINLEKVSRMMGSMITKQGNKAISGETKKTLKREIKKGWNMPKQTKQQENKK